MSNSMIGEVSFLAASGLVQIPLNADEEPTAVVQRIEDIAHCFIHDLVQGRVDGCFRMIRRTSANAFEDEVSGALILGPQVTIRRFNACTATKVAQLLQVLAVMQQLLLQGRRISQREMFYMLIDSFKNQAQLNCTVLDASATLGVRRYALNVGAATRGVLAGCLELATAGSMYKVDCRYVGTNGWPIPGDVRAACSLIVHSNARYIIIIEKFGIFSRLIQDKFYENLPSILLCGKGYPSIATRAVASLLERRLRIPVLGLADFNPHGLALLQCYRAGSARSGVEGGRFGCKLRWLGLRASQITAHGGLGTGGVGLTVRDEAILQGLERRYGRLREDGYKDEMEAMRRLGKFELQWLYGQMGGMGMWLTGVILRGEYL